MFAAVTVNVFLFIVIAFEPQSLSLWLLSPFTLTYTVFDSDTFVALGFVVSQSPVVLVLYSSVPPECPVAVIV